MIKVVSVLLTFGFLIFIVSCLFMQIGNQTTFSASSAITTFLVVLAAWLLGFGCGRFEL